MGLIIKKKKNIKFKTVFTTKRVLDTKYKAPVGSSLVPQHCNMQALTLELPSEDSNLQDKQPSFCFHINGCGQPSTLSVPVGLSLQISVCPQHSKCLQHQVWMQSHHILP